MNRVKTTVLSAFVLMATSGAAFAEPKVVTSIKPVHSLVAAVMQGVAKPELLVEGASSPHTYALKPSQAAKLEKADLVFWIGHQIEAFMEKPVETIATRAMSVELIDAHGLTKLPFREGGAFEDHDHEGHGEHDHKAEAKHDDDHDHKAEAKHDDEHDHKAGTEHDDHGHGSFDFHVWLDPENAKAIVHEIEEALVIADPANGAKYKANARATIEKLDALTQEVAASLAPVKGRNFIVFHDAYQYFENRFGMAASGSIAVSPEVMPGADRVDKIQKKLKRLGAACVFAEPQFEPKLVSVVVEGTKAKPGVLDPLGAALDDGPDLYFALIRNMASAFRDCLSPGS